MQGLYRRSGFTLIELLVLVAVAAILFAIVAPFFHHAKMKAQQADQKYAIQEAAKLSKSSWLGLDLSRETVDRTADKPYLIVRFYRQGGDLNKANDRLKVRLFPESPWFTWVLQHFQVDKVVHLGSTNKAQPGAEGVSAYLTFSE